MNKQQTRRDYYEDETFWRLQVDEGQLTQEQLHRFWYMPDRPERESGWRDELRDMVRFAIVTIVVGGLAVLAVGFLVNRG